MNKKLKTLNCQTSERRSHNDNPVPNGIACPECGTELVDSNPNMMLCSDPPKKAIACTKCEFTGYRIF